MRGIRKNDTKLLLQPSPSSTKTSCAFLFLSSRETDSFNTVRHGGVQGHQLSYNWFSPTPTHSQQAPLHCWSHSTVSTSRYNIASKRWYLPPSLAQLPITGSYEKTTLFWDIFPPPHRHACLTIRNDLSWLRPTYHLRHYKTAGFQLCKLVLELLDNYLAPFNSDHLHFGATPPPPPPQYWIVSNCAPNGSTRKTLRSWRLCISNRDCLLLRFRLEIDKAESFKYLFIISMSRSIVGDFYLLLASSHLDTGKTGNHFSWVHKLYIHQFNAINFLSSFTTTCRSH